MEQFGAGSRPEGIEAYPQSALELIWTHGRSVAPGPTVGEGSIPVRGLDGTQTGLIMRAMDEESMEAVQPSAPPSPAKGAEASSRSATTSLILGITSIVLLLAFVIWLVRPSMRTAMPAFWILYLVGFGAAAGAIAFGQRRRVPKDDPGRVKATIGLVLGTVFIRRLGRRRHRRDDRPLDSSEPRLPMRRGQAASGRGAARRRERSQGLLGVPGVGARARRDAHRKATSTTCRRRTRPLDGQSGRGPISWGAKPPRSSAIILSRPHLGSRSGGGFQCKPSAVSLAWSDSCSVCGAKAATILGHGPRKLPVLRHSRSHQNSLRYISPVPICSTKGAMRANCDSSTGTRWSSCVPSCRITRCRLSSTT